MATKGTKYYNAQTKVENLLLTIMLDNNCSLLRAELILKKITEDAVKAIREGRI